MRLRLFHQLFLVIAASALLAAVAMALVLSFNLKRGFSYYLDAQDAEQMDGFAAAASANIAARGPAAFQGDGQLDIKALIVDMVRRDEIPSPPPAPPGGRAGAGGEALPAQLHRPPVGPRRPRPPPQNFSMRLMMFDAAGTQITGPPPPPDDMAQGMQHRAIMVGGKMVAEARLVPRGPIPSGVEAGFLKGQYRSVALTALLLLVFAAAPALLIARSGARRLAAMQRAANEIAGGNMTARVSVRGHDEIAAMGRDINSMAESLATLDSSRRRWLAEISHELRTPLAVLVGELDALKDGIRPLTAAAVQSLSDEAQRLGRIVGDLHALAMSDLAGNFCQFSACDAAEIAQRAHARFAAGFAEKGIVLELDHAGISALAVSWEQSRIEQTLANVLTNSLRYTQAPGRTVIALSAKGEEAAIHIDDSAPGVPEEHLGHLFEPLYRADTSRARATGGSGLGLAVCAAIVTAHKGSITAAKSPLGGLSVRIVLPREPGRA